MNFRENKKLWTKITSDPKTLPTDDNTGEYCFIHSIHNDCCFRAVWQGQDNCWWSIDSFAGDDEIWYPVTDVDMWMLNPIPYPMASSKYATE